jgi:hypothetical protein
MNLSVYLFAIFASGFVFGCLFERARRKRHEPHA